MSYHSIFQKMIVIYLYSTGNKKESSYIYDRTVPYTQSTSTRTFLNQSTVGLLYSLCHIFIRNVQLEIYVLNFFLIGDIFHLDVKLFSLITQRLINKDSDRRSCCDSVCMIWIFVWIDIFRTLSFFTVYR